MKVLISQMMTIMKILIWKMITLMKVLVSKKMTSLEVLVSKMMAKIIPGSWLFDLPPSVVWWFAAIGTATPTRQLSMTFR